MKALNYRHERPAKEANYKVNWGRPLSLDRALSVDFLVWQGKTVPGKLCKINGPQGVSSSRCGALHLVCLLQMPIFPDTLPALYISTTT